MKTKICSNPDCVHGGEPQPISNFHKKSSSKDGLREQCKDCVLAKTREYDRNHVDERKKYHEKNKKNDLKTLKNWRESPAKYDTWASKLIPYEDVRRNPENEEQLQVLCYNNSCRGWFTPTNSQVNNRVSAINSTRDGSVKENHFYCSDDCKHGCIAFNSHGKNWVIQAKIAKLIRFYIMQKELSEICLKYDKYTCQKCGRSKEEYPLLEFHAHHTIPVVYDPMIASDLWLKDNIRNVVCYCDDCHKEAHHITDCDVGHLTKNKHNVDLFLKMMNLDKIELSKK